MELELHGGLFFKKFKKVLKCFKKIETKILHVDNVEIYKIVKSQFKIQCILGYKKTNLTKFQVLKMCTVHERNFFLLHFFSAILEVV
jgi:hypothetical protein